MPHPDSRSALPLIRWISLLAGLGLVLSCRPPDRAYQLTYWCATNPFEVEFARQIVDEWNADTTRIPVIFQPVPGGQSSEEVIIAAIVGKTTPDIYSNIWPGVIEQYRDAGAVLDLSQFADFDSVLTSRVPASLRDGFRSPDGGYYQMPWKANPLMLYYNGKLLAEAGVDTLPVTYADFIALAPRLVQDFNGDGHFDTWMLDPNILPKWWERFFDFYTFLIAATDGETLMQDGVVNLDRPETRQVLNFFRENYAAGYFPRSLFQEEIFLLDKLAFKVSGPWLMRHLQRYRPDDYQHYGVTNLPRPTAGEGPVHSYGDPKNIVIFSTTPYPAEAWEFVKFMTSKANDRRLLDITDQLPVRKDLQSDPAFSSYFAERPIMRQFADQLPYTSGTDHSIYLQEIFDILSQEYDAASVYAARPVDEAVANMQRRISKLVAREHIRSAEAQD